MTEDLPWDVHAFSEHDDAFPRNSTIDQLFTDQKFEAYRVLGYYAGESAMKAMDAPAPAPAVQDEIHASGQNWNGNGNGNGSGNGRSGALGDRLGRWLRRVADAL